MNLGAVTSGGIVSVVHRIPEAGATVTAAAAPHTAAQPAADNRAPVAPFLNPALADIAMMVTVTPSSIPPPPQSATDPVLYGDSGFLIQAYGAVALLYGPQNISPVYGLPVPPPIPAIEPI